MTGRQNALGVDRIDDGSVEVFDESERLGRPGNCATAQYHQGLLGGAKPSCSPAHRFGRCGWGGRQGAHSHDRRVGGFSDHVDGYFDMNGPRPGACENGKGAGKNLRQLIGLQQGVAKGRDSGDHIPLVGQLMQPAIAHAQLLAAIDAGYHKHRH